EPEIGVRIVEILGDRPVGAGAHLGREGGHVVARRARLGMEFGIGGDLDGEGSSAVAADEGDQVARVAELAHRADPEARRRVAPQGYDPVDPEFAVPIQQGSDRIAGAAHAGQVRRDRRARGGEFGDDVEGLLLHRAAGPVGDAEELRIDRGEFRADGAQLVLADRRIGREEFETDGELVHAAGPGRAPERAGSVASRRAWMKYSRLPSPPSRGLAIQSRTAQPVAVAAAVTVSRTRAIAASERTMPRASSASRPASNWGLTSATSCVSGPARPASAGNTRRSEMN